MFWRGYFTLVGMTIYHHYHPLTQRNDNHTFCSAIFVGNFVKVSWKLVIQDPSSMILAYEYLESNIYDSMILGGYVKLFQTLACDLHDTSIVLFVKSLK